VGVLIALIVTRITGWAQADAVAALTLGLWLGVGAFRLAHEAFHELIDRALPEEEIALVRAILEAETEVLGYHKLRTRHSGHMHYVDVHVEVPAEWSLLRAHGLADLLEKQIEAALAPAVAVIHVDPR
jgi:ferrous-iron efflux pump FieF